MRGSLSATHNHGDGLVKCGDRLLPRRFRVTFTPADNENAPAAVLTFDTSDTGEWSCREVSLSATDHGDAVRRTHLRAMRVGPFGDFGIQSLALQVTAEAAGTIFAEGFADPAGTSRVVRQAPAGRRRLDDAMLSEVAETYRKYSTSGNPTQEIADHFFVERRTASRYVKATRDRGYLGPATKGKASEQ